MTNINAMSEARESRGLFELNTPASRTYGPAELRTWGRRSDERLAPATRELEKWRHDSENHPFLIIT